LAFVSGKSFEIDIENGGNIKKRKKRWKYEGEKKVEI